jgi:hypothetical protein
VSYPCPVHHARRRDRRGDRHSLHARLPRRCDGASWGKVSTCLPAYIPAAAVSASVPRIGRHAHTHWRCAVCPVVTAHWASRGTDERCPDVVHKSVVQLSSVPGCHSDALDACSLRCASVTTSMTHTHHLVPSRLPHSIVAVARVTSECFARRPRLLSCGAPGSHKHM